MPRTITVAAIQMDATPAKTEERLARAETLISQAVEDGAQLVVLPEVFNTGYQYTEENYEVTDLINGQTVTWMKEQAQKHAIHLAGTLLLVDGDDVFNSAFLIAPDGDTWRYDKNYPFMWERAFFREGNGITIAETELGKLGLMICWDSAHADLWRRYAGRVDAMIVMSCPPKLSNPDLAFPDGTRLNVHDLGGILEKMYTPEEHFSGHDLDKNANWLQVPVVHTSGSGTFKSIMPAPTISVASFVAAQPNLWRKLLNAETAWLEAGYDKQTKIVNANGEVIARVNEEGDGYVVSEIELAELTPRPDTAQPAMSTPKLAYFLADVFGTSLTTPIYRRGLRRQWGATMAPLDNSTKVWSTFALGAFLLGWILSGFLRGTTKDD